jgi:membrane-associated protein
MQEFLINLSVHHEILIYAFIVVFACAEGPFLSMIFGVLIRLGYFDFWPVYLALMAGDLIGDVGWYYVGHHFGHRFIKRWGKYFHVTESGVEKVTKIFHDHKHKILFISKITNGLGFALATLITAGIVRIPFRRYLTINLIGQFVWSGFLIGVGYFFSHLYITVDFILGKMFIIALFIILFLMFLGFMKYLQNKIKINI